MPASREWLNDYLKQYVLQLIFNKSAVDTRNAQTEGSTLSSSREEWQ